MLAPDVHMDGAQLARDLAYSVAGASLSGAKENGAHGALDNTGARYLEEHCVIALLELALEALLLEFGVERASSPQSSLSPITWLATWLSRHNPRYNVEAAIMLSKYRRVTPHRTLVGIAASDEQMHHTVAASPTDSFVRKESTRK